MALFLFCSGRPAGPASGKSITALALGQHADQPVSPAAIELPQRAVELAQRLASLHRVSARDQVGEPLGRGQIQACR